MPLSASIQLDRGEAGAATERVNPPQRRPKAPQNARGFNGVQTAPVHTAGARQERSAQADIAKFQRRPMLFANLFR